MIKKDVLPPRQRDRALSFDEDPFTILIQSREQLLEIFRETMDRIRELAEEEGAERTAELAREVGVKLIKSGDENE